MAAAILSLRHGVQFQKCIFKFVKHFFVLQNSNKKFYFFKL